MFLGWPLHCCWGNGHDGTKTSGRASAAAPLLAAGALVLGILSVLEGDANRLISRLGSQEPWVLWVWLPKAWRWRKMVEAMNSWRSLG